MTQCEREDIFTVIGILTALEYVVNEQGIAEAMSEASDILKGLLEDKG